MNEESVPPPGSEPASDPATPAGSDATAQPGTDARAASRPPGRTEQGGTRPAAETASRPDAGTASPSETGQDAAASPLDPEAGPLPGTASPAEGEQDVTAAPSADARPEPDPLPGPGTTSPPHTRHDTVPSAGSGPEPEADPRPDTASTTETGHDTAADPSTGSHSAPETGPLPGLGTAAPAGAAQDTATDLSTGSDTEPEADPRSGSDAASPIATGPESVADARQDSPPDSGVDSPSGPRTPAGSLPADDVETVADSRPRPQAHAPSGPAGPGARPDPSRGLPPTEPAPAGADGPSWRDAYEDSPAGSGAEAPEDSPPGFSPGGEAGAASAPPAEHRRLARSQEGRLITGVCSGLARYTRIDAIIFRVGFALLVIATGIGILLYIAAFLLMGAPDGGPSRIERAAKRVFDGDTVLILLGAVLGVSVVFKVVGNLGSGDALAVVVVFGLALLVARSRGVDLVQVTRSLPDRIKGQPLSSWRPDPPAPAASRLSDGMIDLARLGRRSDTYAAGPYSATPPTATTPTPPYGPEPYEADPYGRHPTDPYGTDPYAKGPYAADDAPPYSPPPETPHVHRHRRSYLTALTLLAAALAAAVLYPIVRDRPNLVWLQIVTAGALAVIALGLLLGAWFGRDRKLVLVGAIMSFALASTSIAGNAAVARKTHHQMWRPAVTAQADQSHKVLVGQGVVDLTAVPLVPGQRLQVSAEVTLGMLAVKVPATARLEVDGHAYIGDITVDRQVTSGPGARVNRVLEPEAEVPGGTPTIVLHLRSKVGDMEVTRVPA